MIVCYATLDHEFWTNFLTISEYTVAYESECNNCRIGCEKIYAPICALDSDGNEVQYGNQCQFDSYNCQNKNNRMLNDGIFSSKNWWNLCDFYYFSEQSVAYEGECHKCTVACIDIYDPVCSVDSAGNEKTWGNQCEFDSYKCRYPYNGN